MKKGGAPTLRDFCQMYYEVVVAEGVKAEVAFTQARERKRHGLNSEWHENRAV